MIFFERLVVLSCRIFYPSDSAVSSRNVTSHVLCSCVSCTLLFKSGRLIRLGLDVLQESFLSVGSASGSSLICVSSH